MAYRIVITPPAKRRLDMYVGYTAKRLKNIPAAKGIIKDARLTCRKLSETADTVKLCDNPVLAEHGYRKFHFLRHDFVILFRIDENTVIIDGMFHELQDYEATFVNELNL